MNYILFDGASRNALLPFTYTRPVADIRIGILTIREKWEKYLGYTTSTVTEEYLEEKFPMVELEENVMINASFLPTEQLIEKIEGLSHNQAIFYKDQPIAFYVKEDEEVNFDVYDIFIEEGARLEFTTLNASNGPIYIGKDAEVMEGSMIRGPFALCDHATVKMGAKIYGGTTIGPYSKVGGEVSNSVIFGYSNKGHDGFLGNSVLGEWCNLGADTNTSNLKNNYASVRLWSYETEGFAKTGLQFCGLMMGDHSKCGINTMFNTGTVVGVNANIFGGGFPRNFIPSYSWGGNGGFTTYVTKKAFEVAKVVMTRRDLEFTAKEEKILSAIFENTRDFRKGYE